MTTKLQRESPFRTAPRSYKGGCFMQHGTSCSNCHNHPIQRPLGTGNPIQIDMAPPPAIPHHKNLINQNAMKVSTFCEQMSAPSELSLNRSACKQAGNHTAHCCWESLLNECIYMNEIHVVESGNVHLDTFSRILQDDTGAFIGT